jgi:transposase-like protein
MSEDSTVQQAQVILAAKKIKDIVNHGFKVCCPNCHSVDHDIYHTGQLGPTIERPEEDFHWCCKACGYIWNSEFLGARYGFRSSALTGQFSEQYKKRGFWGRLISRFRVRWLKKSW